MSLTHSSPFVLAPDLLEYASLEYASLENASLEYASLENASLENAFLRPSRRQCLPCYYVFLGTMPLLVYASLGPGTGRSESLDDGQEGGGDGPAGRSESDPPSFPLHASLPVLPSRPSRPKHWVASHSILRTLGGKWQHVMVLAASGGTGSIGRYWQHVMVLAASGGAHWVVLATCDGTGSIRWFVASCSQFWIASRIILTAGG